MTAVNDRSNAPTLTPTEAQYLGYASRAYNLLRAKKFEKLVTYVVGIFAATNGFGGALAIGHTIDEVLLGGAAAVLAAIHISTPVSQG